MFDELIKKMAPLEIGDSDLRQVISKDAKGGDVTLGALLDENASQTVLASFGRQPRRHPVRIKSVAELDDQEVKQVVQETLDAIPKGQSLAVAGYGSFSLDQLRDELKRQTEIGRRFAEIVIQHNAFIERAIKMGKIRSRSGGGLKLPSFDF